MLSFLKVRYFSEAEEQSGSVCSDKSSESGAVVFADISELDHKLNLNSERSNNDVENDSVSPSIPQENFQTPSMETKHKKNLYNAFKELFMSERTFTHDLKILVQKFFDCDGQLLSKYGRAVNDLHELLRILYNFHQSFLKEIEEKLSEWCFAVQDRHEPTLIALCELILCSVHNVIQHYRNLVQHSPIYIAAIDELKRTDKSFAKKVREFESDPVCYIPLQWLLLDTVFHMTVWQNVTILGRVIASFLEEGDNLMQDKHLSSCRIAMEKIATFNAETALTREWLINFVKLLEIESEIDGVDNITQANRHFIREGFLRRWNNNNMVPHIVVAFSDVLLYATLPQEDGNFVVNGIIPYRDAQVDEGEITDPMAVSRKSFVICTSKNAVILSANTEYLKEVWKDDMRKVIKVVNETKIEHLPQQICVKFFGYDDPTEESVKLFNLEKNTFKSSDALNQRAPKESNKISTLRLCWHRQTTIAADGLLKAATNQLSGYLLRKYRTSSGWQRLWVVLAAFTLFFYKEHTEEIPLASLNLIDYNVSLPLVSDGVSKDNVFKLSYLKQSYFFGAEDVYQFARWTEAIRIATQHGSPKDVLADLIARSV